jgi:hypothetical protein
MFADVVAVQLFDSLFNYLMSGHFQFTLSGSNFVDDCGQLEQTLSETFFF